MNIAIGTRVSVDFLLVRNTPTYIKVSDKDKYLIKVTILITPVFTVILAERDKVPS